MFPCCELCYEKYINQDGSIDEDRLKDIIKRRRRDAGDRTLFSDLVIRDPDCRCECHRDGIEVMH